MSGWNYRVVRHSPAQGEPYLAIHEVYYEDGHPAHISESPTQPVAADLLGMIDLVGRLHKATMSAPLDMEEFMRQVRAQKEREDVGAGAA